jgi:7-keto-8-aminopelargonate synthetase-like enzyme
VDTQELQQVALFEKCRQFTKAREMQAVGLYPYFKPISESEDTVVVIDGQKKIMLGSNNYLGLTHHPKALARYGSGCTGSRFLNGTLDLHQQLESALAEFLGKEACLIFSTGYSANLGLIAGLVGRGDVVYLDKLDHASIVDGAKLSYGETERFNHGDLASLERRLERNGPSRGAMIVVPDRAEVWSGPGARRRARHRRAWPQWRRNSGPLRNDRRGGYHRRHVLQVPCLHRRVRGGIRKRHPLSPAP